MAGFDADPPATKKSAPVATIKFVPVAAAPAAVYQRPAAAHEKPQVAKTKISTKMALVRREHIRKRKDSKARESG